MPRYHLKENTTHPDYKQSHYIHIDEGQFEGLCFNFGKLQFMGEDPDGNGRIQFEYDLISSPESLILNDETTPQLEAVVSEILNEIIINTLEDQELNETRDSDTDELNS